MCKIRDLLCCWDEPRISFWMGGGGILAMMVHILPLPWTSNHLRCHNRTVKTIAQSCTMQRVTRQPIRWKTESLISMAIMCMCFLFWCNGKVWVLPCLHLFTSRSVLFGFCQDGCSSKRTLVKSAAGKTPLMHKKRKSKNRRKNKTN